MLLIYTRVVSGGVRASLPGYGCCRVDDETRIERKRTGQDKRESALETTTSTSYDGVDDWRREIPSVYCPEIIIYMSVLHTHTRYIT